MSRTINKIFESATTQQDFKRGDIYYIERTGQETGCEQRAGRPAVIVSNDTGNRHGETIMVVYLTTQPKADLPTHTTIYSTARASTVLCENVETVSKLRVGGYRGRATPDEMRDIDEALAVALALKLPETQQDTPQTTAEAQKLKEAEEQIDTAEKAQREAEEAARTAKRETAFYKQLYEETLEKCRKLACGGATA